MKKMMIPSLLALALIMTVMISPGFADEPDLSDKTISDWKFSGAVSGDEPTEENLKGKVVALEYWGVR